MPLTPAEVHNVAFKKPPIGKRGYDEEEVDAFLDIVEVELSRLLEENNELKTHPNGSSSNGVATGGASIVVKPTVTSAAQLKGQSLATPSLGNTQDVALRYWLKQNGVTTNTTGGGDAFIKPTKPNSAAVLQFKSGQIAGGSEPAPYDIQMVQDGGTVLLKEPGVTTLLIVTKSFLAAHPAVVSDLLKAQVQANAFIKSNPTQAQADANAELATYTGKSLKPDLVAASFKEITFTNDPNAASLKTAADQAVSLGLLKPVNLDGIYALDPLNKVLAEAGESQISS